MRTITSQSDIERLFAHGRRVSQGPVSLLVARSPDNRDPAGRVMFAAGRKLGGAVMRNRCKRVLRESCRRVGGPWAGFDVALMARAGAATSSPLELDAAVTACLRRCGLAKG